MGLWRFHCLWWNLTKWYWQCSLFSQNKEGNVILSPALVQLLWYIANHQNIYTRPSTSLLSHARILHPRQRKKTILPFLLKISAFKHTHTQTHTQTHMHTLHTKRCWCVDICALRYDVWMPEMNVNGESKLFLMELWNHRPDLWLSGPATLKGIYHSAVCNKLNTWIPLSC